MKKYLYKKRILKFTRRKIKHWIKDDVLDMLELASRYASYNLRKELVNELTGIEDSKFQHLLVNLLFDPVKSVSDAAIKKLENSKNISLETEEKIKIVKLYWEVKRQSESFTSPRYISNISFDNIEFSKAKLMHLLDSQIKGNHPPFGF